MIFNCLLWVRSPNCHVNSCHVCFLTLCWAPFSQHSTSLISFAEPFLEIAALVLDHVLESRLDLCPDLHLWEAMLRPWLRHCILGLSYHPSVTSRQRSEHRQELPAVVCSSSSCQDSWLCPKGGQGKMCWKGEGREVRADKETLVTGNYYLVTETKESNSLKKEEVSGTKRLKGGF